MPYAVSMEMAMVAMVISGLAIALSVVTEIRGERHFRRQAELREAILRARRKEWSAAPTSPPPTGNGVCNVSAERTSADTRQR